MTDSGPEMDVCFHYVAKLRQLFLLAVLPVSLLVPITTATARCYNPTATASRLEEQLREEQALTAKTAYTSVFDPGHKVQIGLLRWYDPNLQRWIDRDPLEEAYDVNLYRFVGNDPVNTVDVNGLWPTGAYGSQNVHGNSINRALSFLPPNDREILIQQQIFADLDQTARGSYRHAMRDGTCPETSLQAALRANRYVRNLLLQAQRLEAQGKHADALARLGLAIHTLQDSTSPEHFLFKPWNGNEHGFGALHHGLGENFDPLVGSQLDTATRAAYDYFIGAKPMPRNFFTFRPDVRPVWHTPREDEWGHYSPGYWGAP